VFGSALVILAALLSAGAFFSKRADWNDSGVFYRTLARDLPDDAALMVNDPAALYYHTGLSGVVVPDADPGVVPEIAAHYGIHYLVLDSNRTQPFAALFEGKEDRSFLWLYKVYGTDTEDRSDDRRVFEIILQEQEP
jgi:hypothetical protein